MVHRDIKKGNIVWNEDRQLRLIDYSLAARVDPENEKSKRKI